ncbi:hypothetical protein HPB51_016162 [Rhipicephalus microplus]|uniref:Thioredoxin like 4A n=1 Tax=Rhipicephalus microplus TaxID=6941 RepID=A0A9J6E1F7_RHIMP|nr:hypothetical protein HPB51_016162 [Rhipicephalus microplus]
MSYMLQHLHNGWQVDQAILSEEDRVVVIRFGHDWDPTCMKMDEVLYSIVEKVPYSYAWNLIVRLCVRYLKLEVMCQVSTKNPLRCCYQPLTKTVCTEYEQ